MAAVKMSVWKYCQILNLSISFGLFADVFSWNPHRHHPQCRLQWKQGIDLIASSTSEEDKIKAVISQSSSEYDSSRFVKRPYFGPPPATYVCQKCQKPGHWIQRCPNAVSRLHSSNAWFSYSHNFNHLFQCYYNNGHLWYVCVAVCSSSICFASFSLYESIFVQDCPFMVRCQGISAGCYHTCIYSNRFF